MKFLLWNMKLLSTELSNCSLISIVTGSTSPGFQIRDLFPALTGDTATNWIWDLFHARQLVFQWVKVSSQAPSFREYHRFPILFSTTSLWGRLHWECAWQIDSELYNQLRAGIQVSLVPNQLYYLLPPHCLIICSCLLLDHWPTKVSTIYIN